MTKWKTLLLMVIVVALLAACGGGAPGGATQAVAPSNGDAAAKAVEAYLTAKVKVDQDGVRKLLCSEKEKDAETEATTFLGVDQPKIEGMQCALIGDNKVKCDGKITAQYGAEKNEFPLVTYRVVQEDGEWKWCGETK
jgi:hypothetical protein